MPRPKKATDEQVFDAAVRVMSRLGPSELTLAAIAHEAGVTAATLVQRFGSRRDLLLALAERIADNTPDLFSDLRKRYHEPLAAIRAYAACYAGMGESAAAVARNLAYLLQDLTDPDLKSHVRAQARRTRAGLRLLVRDAVRAGALKPDTDVRALARTIEGDGSHAIWKRFSGLMWRSLLGTFRVPDQSVLVACDNAFEHSHANARGVALNSRGRSGAAAPERRCDRDGRRAPASLFDDRRTQASFQTESGVDQSPDLRGFR
jgi:AcrR family transcriptional regulator